MLDISAVAPSFKNEAFIEKFDALKPGQGFVLANDESSEAYYGLLSASRGLDFEWEPLEQGPTQWTARIVKRLLKDDEETIGAIVARDYRKSRELFAHDIDFCCSGDRTLSEALNGDTAAINEILKQWEAIDQCPAEEGIDYQSWSLSLLTNYIGQIHHTFVRTQSSFIADMAFKVGASNSDRYPQINKVAQIFALTGKIFEAQISREEQLLFPYIHQLPGHTLLQRPGDINDNSSVTQLISVLKVQSIDIIGHLRQIRALTDNYTAPAYALGTCKILYRLLADYEADALLHLHLKNNILFPKVLQSQPNYRRTDIKP
ncbi:regulator of cell morphogenesis and NO signaling [Mucilaginibacter sp. AK015]|nr:regulator of cell morphogenesis and NO signaling [Mucilaginibacter sp. AK015]